MYTVRGKYFFKRLILNFCLLFFNRLLLREKIYYKVESFLLRNRIIFREYLMKNLEWNIKVHRNYYLNYYLNTTITRVITIIIKLPTDLLTCTTYLTLVFSSIQDIIFLFLI